MPLTLLSFKSQKIRHDGFLQVLLPKSHSGVLGDAGVTPLKELRCLENPSGLFDQSSWAFVSVGGKIYVARGMSCRTTS